jgi:uncharacterized protein
VNEQDEKPQSLDRYWDPDLEVLGEFLDQLEEDGAMSLEELDGFFTALVCGPDLVMPNEYLPIVVGGEFANEEVFPNIEAVRLFFDLVTHHWNEIVAALNAGDFFLPLLLEDGEGNAYGNDWAIGFLRGMDLRRSSWNELLDDENAGPLIPIFALAHELDPDPELRPYKEPVSQQLRERLLAGVSSGVTLIYDYFAPQRQALTAAGIAKSRRQKHKIGRNDPCYCGSGKKYKKCCGQLPVN